jgi:hypothetical protein
MNWASADAALAYGYGICNKITEGRPYAEIAGDFKADFQTSDESLASYVISDAAQQLCPELIRQLRNSAAITLRHRRSNEDRPDSFWIGSQFADALIA